ncbi:NTPase KAP family P-loop domain-containing protein 1-like [Lampetra fluviatilis]
MPTATSDHTCGGESQAIRVGATKVNYQSLEETPEDKGGAGQRDITGNFPPDKDPAMDNFELDEYNQYAMCLAKALCYAATPITVGLYAPWGSGGGQMLKKIQDCLIKGSQRIAEKEYRRTQTRPRSANGPCGLLALVFRLLFFIPVVSQRQREQLNVRFIFVSFNAWEFAGSNRLWAGLVTALCEQVRSQFRPLPTSIYRALGRKTVPRLDDKDEVWNPKMFLCLPLWAITIIFVMMLAAFIVVIVGIGFPSHYGGDVVSAIEGIAGSMLGISTLFFLKSSMMVVRNLFWTQKDQVERLMDKKDFSAELGFMNNVKQEVNIITNFLRFMEVFERNKIRVVLNVQDLDRCDPEKIVEVLEAMSILLSDKEARFISILSVDPSVVVESVEQIRTKGGAKDFNGYELLNRFVDLPFSMPSINKGMKSKLLDHMIKSTSASVMMRNPEKVVCVDDEMDVAIKMEELTPLRKVGSAMGSTFTQFRSQTKETIEEAHSALRAPNGNLCNYVDENIFTMRRIINTVPVFINLLLANQVTMGTNITPEKLSAWTVLSTQWPGRFSWLIQCLDDKEDRQDIDEQGIVKKAQSPCRITDATPLWDIFEDSLHEMCDLLSQMERLLKMDGDPDQFEKFLSKDYRFTVGDFRILNICTINLDRSLQRKMELLRGNYSIKMHRNTKGAECRQLGRLVSEFTRIHSMSPEDVCKEMEALELSSERLADYRSRAVEHGVSGRALLHGTEEEVRRALGMEALGDWATFRDHFLRLLADHQETSQDAWHRELRDVWMARWLK